MDGIAEPIENRLCQPKQVTRLRGSEWIAVVLTDFSEVGHINIVVRTIGGAPSILTADLGGRGVREIVVNCR